MVCSSEQERDELLQALQWLAGEGGNGPSLQDHTVLSRERLARMLAELDAQYEKCWSILTQGSTFQQFKGSRILVRYVRTAVPRLLRSKSENNNTIPFQALLKEIEQVRIIFTTVEDKTAPTALIKAADLEYVMSGCRGSIFPKINGESICDDNRALVIGAKHGVGLQAKTEKHRNMWVEALAWLEKMVKARQLQREEALQFQKEFANAHVLDPLLSEGAWFTKHGLHGVSKRFILSTPTQLYWLKEADSPLDSCVDPIEWREVKDVLRGKQTAMLHRARAIDVPDELCLSIVYRQDRRSLDLVAGTSEQAFEWYESLSSYLVETNEKLANERSEARSSAEKQLAAAEAELLGEKESRQRQQARLGMDIEETKKELAERKAALDAEQAVLIQQQVEQLKERDDLISLIQELDTRVGSLRENLDDQ